MKLSRLLRRAIMPTYFWNAGEKSLSSGLDILGIRRVDQDFEKPWVSGITTISERARYLTALTWLLREYYGTRTREAKSPKPVDWADYQRLEQRLEFVMLAATRLTDATLNRTTVGLLGGEVYSTDLDRLMSGASVILSDAPRTGLFGTYVSPARGFGLLSQEGIQGPWEAPKITPRGERVHALRSRVLAGSPLVEAIITGSAIELAAVRADASHFSAGALDQPTADEERQALEEAMLDPLEGQDRDQYQRFRCTIRFGLRWASEGLGESRQVLALNLGRFLSGQQPSDTTSLHWALYELLRRVHFALELLLDALTTALISQDGGTVEDIVATCADDESDSEIVLQSLRQPGPLDWSLTLNDLLDRVRPGIACEQAISRRWTNLAAPRDKCSMALILLADSWRSTTRASQRRIEPVARSGIDGVFPLLSSHAGASLRELLVILLKRCIVEPHLATTLRKMSHGLKCSLRFYPDGSGLRPTGLEVSAGFSGDRLSNVLGILSDLGMIVNADGGTSLSDRGQQLLRRLDKELVDA